jgi:signal transduction histidine kinase
VAAIEREIARIAAVTRQLYETYQAEPEVAAMTSLANVVGDAVLFTQQVNPNSGVRVVSDLSRAPMLVGISGAVLRQVMYNLVQNAMESAPEGSTVSITAELRDQLEIRVIDSGPGVATEIRERIFEPFFSTKDKRQGASGMGLGLFLVRRSVRAAGGDVRAEPNPAGGAIFVVTLPIQSRT